MIKLKMCLALALISATLLTALPFYSYADIPGKMNKKPMFLLYQKILFKLKNSLLYMLLRQAGNGLKRATDAGGISMRTEVIQSIIGNI